MLTTKHIQIFQTNGYVIIQKVFSAKRIEELRRVTDEFVEQSRKVTIHTNVFDLESGHTTEAQRLRRLKYPELQHQAYDRI